jgi:AAA ATPase-like protein
MSTDTARPVGRAREFESLVGVFSEPTPALLVISGDPGTGRSHLLAALQAVANESGFRSIGVDEQFFVGPATTTSDVLRVLEATLEDRAGVEREDDGPTAGSEQPTSKAGGLAGAVSSFATRTVDLLRRSVVETRIFTILDHAAPLMLAVDGYSASTAFDHFMVGRLVPALRSRKVPVVIVVTGSAESTKNLSASADLVEALGPLDVDEVRTHFEALASNIVPAVTDAELDAYATAASKAPSLLDAFARVFDVLAAADR